MTDEELLAFYRQRYPYLPLSIAKELRRADLKYWHLSAIAKKKEREAKEEELRRLHAKVFRRVPAPLWAIPRADAGGLSRTRLAVGLLSEAAS
jgi:hypothetical protein